MCCALLGKDIVLLTIAGGVAGGRVYGRMGCIVCWWEAELAAAFTQIEKILKALIRTRGVFGRTEKLLRDECV